jgi:hypothetical protein
MKRAASTAARFVFLAPSLRYEIEVVAVCHVS